MKTIMKTSLLVGACALAMSACKKAPEKISLDADPIERVQKAFEIAQSTQGDGNPAIWKMADEDTTIYLYGTVHLLKPETVWKTPEFDAAFKSADTFYMEADVQSPAAMQEMQQAMMSKAIFNDGGSLKGALSDTEYTKLSGALAEFNIKPTDVDQMKPWMVSLQLLQMQMAKGGYNPLSGVESVLTATAKQDGKSLGYFERAADQIDLLAGGTIEEQVEGLMFQLDTMEQTPELLDSLIAEWADGDITGLGVLMGDPAMFGSVEAYNGLIKERNANWVPQIEAILDKPGTSFVAVGAGHLAGPDSVVTMLEAKGHKIEVVQ